MAELAQVEPVKKAGFVSQRKTKYQERIQKDEQELKELIEQDAQKETNEEQDTTPAQEPTISKEEESFKKRYGDIRRHMDKQKQDYDARIEALEAQLSKAAKNELVLPKTNEEIEAWTKKYPDVAAIVETIADKKASERSKDLDERVKQIEEMRFNSTRENAEAELLTLHPDFAEIRDEIADDAKSTARVIDLYKTDKGISKVKSNSKSAASAVNTRGRTAPASDSVKGQWTESQVEKMSDKQYTKHQEEIMESIRSGKFVYDISGGAR